MLGLFGCDLDVTYLAVPILDWGADLVKQLAYSGEV